MTPPNDPNPADFWQALDQLVATSQIVIDRPKGSRHPLYPDNIYPLDYGYLKDTTATDGGGIDIWRGSQPTGDINAVICTVDLVKRDSEIKILIGCTPAEVATVHKIYNTFAPMKGILIEKPCETAI